MAWDDRYQKEFIRRLRSRLPRLEPPQPEILLQGLEHDIEQVIAASSHMAADQRTRPHLRLAATVLASHRAIASGSLDRSAAIQLIEDVFAGIGRTGLRLYTLALLTFSRDPFTAITRAGKRRALEQYGREWELSVEETDQSFSMTATKCFYADFFQAAGKPELTRVFCRWDHNWIEPIEPAKHKIRFERPTTIGYGGKECPFLFVRIVESARNCA